MMLLCSNVLLADAQRGKLSTSVKSDRPKDGGLRSNSAENTNKTSAISVKSAAGDKDKVAENEKDVLAAKPVAITPAKDETDDVRKAAVEKQKDAIDTKDLDNEKVPTKRDLPFVIQSSAGTVKSHSPSTTPCTYLLELDGSLEWIAVYTCY